MRGRDRDVMRLAVLTLILGAVLGVGGYRMWDHRLDGATAQREAEQGISYVFEGGHWQTLNWVDQDGGWRRHTEEVRGADAPTFRALENVYAVDKDAAYLFGRRVARADPSTFRVIDRMQGLYSADKAHVFYEGHVLPGADGATFRRVRDDWFRDAKRLYWLGHEVVGADPESFQFFLTASWERDKNGIYRGYTPVHVEDLQTFVPINFLWAKDFKAYYCSWPPKRSSMRVSCDYASMVVLNNVYAKDKDHGYCGGIMLYDSDGATFHVIDTDFAEDKLGRYHGLRRVSEEEASEQLRLETVIKQVQERRAERAADKAGEKP
jgi:hypothetical protein